MARQFQVPQLAALQAGLTNPTPLLEELERVLVADNREGLLAGTDGDGRPLAPLAASTLKKRKGTGPPLIPQFTASRAIANYRTAHGQDGPGRWVVLGAWENVLSRGGVPFLPFHFRGEGRLPTRDIANIRPEGMRRAREAVLAFGLRLIRRR